MSMRGADQMDQNILTYMINLYTKKWSWLLFRFAVDVLVNNADQIYRQSYLNPGKYRSDAHGFCRVVVDAYYHFYRKSLPSVIRFRGSRNLHHPADNLQFDSINHWIAKCSQRRCSLKGCKGTSIYYSKKCNVGLHAECFKLYHCK